MTADHRSRRKDASPSRKRYVPTAVYAMAARLKRTGVKLGIIPGPWHTDEHVIPIGESEKFDVVPVVTNGETNVMVDTMEHALDLAGLLNWCGLDRLNPVPELRVPPVPRPVAR